MNFIRQYIILLILFFLFPVKVFSQEQIDSTYLPISDEDIISGEIYHELKLLNKELNIQKNLINADSQSLVPNYYYLQSSFKNSNDYTYPSFRNRLLLKNNHWEMFVLTHNDANEKDINDLFRFAIQNTQPHVKLILGDFGINYGLGLTIRTIPSFRSKQNPFHISSVNHDVISVNHSSEEGRGWRGGAAKMLLNQWDLNIWGGFAEYDGYYNNSELYFYSTQGDHADSSLPREKIKERNIGVCLNRQINRFDLSLLHYISDFSEDFDLEGQPSRFNNLQHSLHQSAVNLSYKEEKLKINLEGNINPNSNGAVAFQVELKNRKIKNYLYAYHAEKHLINIHSRPLLPFGGNLNGKSGICLGVDSPVNDFIIGGWFGIERVETESGKESMYGGNLYASHFKQIYESSAIIFYRSNFEEYGNFDNYQSRGIRLKFGIDSFPRKYGIYSELSERLGEKGSALSVYYREKVSQYLQYGIITGYTNPLGGDGRVSLYQMSGKGEFPVSFSGGQGLHYSIEVEYHIWRTLDFWSSLAFYENKLENESDFSDNNKNGKLIWRAGLIFVSRARK